MDGSRDGWRNEECEVIMKSCDLLYCVYIHKSSMQFFWRFIIIIIILLIRVLILLIINYFYNYSL